MKYRNITMKSASVPFRYPEKPNFVKWNSKRAIPRRAKKVTTVSQSRLVPTLQKKSRRPHIGKLGNSSKMRSFILKPKI